MESLTEQQEEYGIIPDIVLKENKNNLKLEINNSQMPKFNFNNSLYKIIKKKKLLNREKNNLINWAKAGKLLLDSIKND